MPTDILIPGSPLGWPPPVRLRVSRRARNASLRICPRDGLVVVLPDGFSPSRYLEILAVRRAWIERHLAKRREMFPAFAGACDDVRPKPPELLDFLAVGERVRVDYVSGPGRPRLRENSGGRLLIVTGPEPGSEPDAHAGNTPGARANAVRDLLIGYVKKAGARILPGLLTHEARAAGLALASCSVGFAARRWGSCTTKGAIRLSAKLLFLPNHLARHVMLHELAHLRHCNHSQAYYRFLATLDPDWRAHNRELNRAQSYLPLLLW
ncbi:MAG: M48 family metallopeptidase [Desulfovibrionaceae bacterium]|nr:M48 family metallopeptidase [Desulfovibrionaceae bacterium]MBF0512987.1 M48 family metallopeptidase [Desulfovibrionaceae bacterium]